MNYSKNNIPQIFKDVEILAPCKVDVMFGGARYVDSLLWNIFGSVLSPEEFAAGIVRDLSLPMAFRASIAMQLCEQVEAYADLVCTIYSLLDNDNDKDSGRNHDEKISSTTSTATAKAKAIEKMMLSLRHVGVEYTDIFDYDTNNAMYSPEEFAIQTCADLGLPAELEPAIAMKMRDTITHIFTQSLCAGAPADDVDADTHTIIDSGSDSSGSKITVNIVSPTLTSEMCQNMWRDCKPENIDVTSASSTRPSSPSASASASANVHVHVQNSMSKKRSANMCASIGIDINGYDNGSNAGVWSCSIDSTNSSQRQNKAKK